MSRSRCRVTGVRITCLVAAILLLSGLKIRAEGIGEADELNQPVNALASLIPFEMECLEPGDVRWADALEVDLFVTDEGPDRWIALGWTVRDGDDVQLSCRTFDELYHRCDGPEVFSIRVITCTRQGTRLRVGIPSGVALTWGRELPDVVY